MAERRSTINYINQKYSRGENDRIIHDTIPTSVINKRQTIRTSEPITHLIERTIPEITQRRILTRGTPVGVIPGRLNTSQIGRVQGVVNNRSSIRHQSAIDLINNCQSYKMLGCPWWLLFLLAIISIFTLIVIVGCVTGLFSKHRIIIIDQSKLKSEVSQSGCSEGYFQHDGKCINCPEGSQWNGSNCTKTQEVVVQPNVSTQKVCGQNKVWNGNECVACPSGMQWNGTACINSNNHLLSNI